MGSNGGQITLTMKHMATDQIIQTLGNQSGRNPDRIPELLGDLQARWQCNPDLRLMQLLIGLINPKEPCPEAFYLEDDVLMALIRRNE